MVGKLTRYKLANCENLICRNPGILEKDAPYDI